MCEMIRGVWIFVLFQFEGQEARELKQIFQGQETIHRVVRDLSRKLDEVIGRQERTLSQLSIMGQGGVAVQQPGHAGGGVSCAFSWSWYCEKVEIESIFNSIQIPKMIYINIYILSVQKMLISQA